MSEEKTIALSPTSINDLANAPKESKIEFLRKMGTYIGAETDDVNSLLNTPIIIRGVLIHDATINQGQTIDPATGAMVPNYITAERTVFKRDNGNTVAFVSIAVANFVRQFILPLFGMGDWADENGEPILLTIKVTQVEAKGGRSYNIKIV